MTADPHAAPASTRVITGYNITPEADDGLALGRLLARLLGGELVVARVLGTTRNPIVDRHDQRDRHDLIDKTRVAVMAALPTTEHVDVVPIPGSSIAEGLRDLGDAEHAALIALGSTHHSALGRLVLGATAEVVIAGAHRPVAVATTGFHARPELRAPLVTVAYDGSPACDAALRMGARLAAAAGARLRVLAVHAPWLQQPLPHSGERHAERHLSRARGLLPPGAEAEFVVRDGGPGSVLAEETGATGLLLMGTHARGPVRRAVTGSVATHVLRTARCPVVVCPPPLGKG
jgi:nucleotide-binding universal stress UspA family protein